jgi:hypothetical protein
MVTGVPFGDFVKSRLVACEVSSWVGILMGFVLPRLVGRLWYWEPTSPDKPTGGGGAGRGMGFLAGWFTNSRAKQKTVDDGGGDRMGAGSTIGSALVSKTNGCEFKSCPARGGGCYQRHDGSWNRESCFGGRGSS